MPHDKVILSASVNGKLPRLNAYLVKPEVATTAKEQKVSRELLHRRLIHAGEDRIEKLLKENLADGIEVLEGSTYRKICEPCIQGKATKQSHPKKSETIYENPGDLVVTDLKGPLKPMSREGFKYWATYTDAATRKRFIFGLRKKSEQVEKFKEVDARFQRLLGRGIRMVRDDKGGEYTSRNYLKYLREQGISHQKTNVAAPEENGIAERLNRTIQDGITTMLRDANLPSNLWYEAVVS